MTFWRIGRILTVLARMLTLKRRKSSKYGPSSGLGAIPADSAKGEKSRISIVPARKMLTEGVDLQTARKQFRK